MAKKNRTPKRLTKRQRKALEGKKAGTTEEHIHAHQFVDRPSTARWLRCQHGTKYACCAGCVQPAKQRLLDHDRSGRPVQQAAPWH